MIDERFSASAFSSCGLDTEKARSLSDRLTVEIESEMQEVLRRKFTQIIGHLNEMGHDLKPYVIGKDELSYRDDYDSGDSYHCKLRVAVDLIVSTGYAHLSFPEEAKDLEQGST